MAQALGRREIIELLATGAACLGVRQLLPAGLLLPASAAGWSVSGWPSTPSVPQDQSLPAPLLPLFPLRLVLLPHSNLALHIFEERYKEMIRDCLQNQWEFGIVLAREDSIETIGCTASISEVLRRYPDGRMDILVRGQRPFEVSLLNREKSYLRGEAKFFAEDQNETLPETLRQQAIRLYDRLSELIAADDPSSQPLAPLLTEEQLSFQIMAELPADLELKQRLLEFRSEHDRLVEVVLHMQQLIEYMENGPGAPAPKTRV